MASASDLLKKLARQPAVHIILVHVARAVLAVTHAVGIHVSRHRRHQVSGDLDSDIKVLLGDSQTPVLFDVGANVGQSAVRFNKLVPGSAIHSFEPSPSAFRDLVENTSRCRNVRAVNAALASAAGATVLFEYDQSVMSSLLSAGSATMGHVVGETPIEVMTVDAYCVANNIDVIDLLKIDTQGYDFEVLKGSERLISAGRVRIVLLEVIFADLYEGQAAFDQVYRFLIDRKFRLVGLYDCETQKGMMAWANVMFVNAAWAKCSGFEF